MRSAARLTGGLALPLACVVALAIPATSAGAKPSVRSCGRGAVKEYPYFDVRAHGAPCAAAQRLIRRFLCTGNRGGHCFPGNHWHIKDTILIGHWVTPAGWHCQARIPPPLHEDGRPFGNELCRRGSAWVSSKSFG